ncbi:hypothetical protein [Aquipseudomonas alcaligenes]|uniref:hypothetical protein n=1 Tax=Aquipseudomonas alcaligenes TaxID=43263 RepID=UPI001F1D91BA|nr:hypothetical protein [Pseudomonas alcaligenes]BDC78564.1 hypothetical protein MRCP2_p2990 [Pseudomonas alcaligenes]
MNMNTQFIRLPNGRVWLIDSDKVISGTVRVPGYEGLHYLESRLDAISEAVADGFVGLSGFSYSYIGDDLVSFTGSLDELPNDPDEWGEEGCELLTPDSPALRDSLKEQYGLSEIEVDHALAALGHEYGDECVTQKVGSIRQIRTPAYPSECDYVRVVVDGLEIAHWSSDEWADDPMTVMGAIFGAAAGPSK